MEIKPKSVFRRGAEDGTWFGIYLSVLFILSAVSIKISILGLLAFIMALAVPIYAYIILRKGFIQNGCLYTFFEVWTHGIVLFACGSLIMALTMVIYLNWVNPSFIVEQSKAIVSLYNDLGGDWKTMAQVVEQAINQGLLPTPISMASDIISLGIFSGSMLTLILTPFIRRNPTK